MIEHRVELPDGRSQKLAGRLVLPEADSPPAWTVSARRFTRSNRIAAADLAQPGTRTSKADRFFQRPGHGIPA